MMYRANQPALTIFEEISESQNYTSLSTGILKWTFQFLRQHQSITKGVNFSISAEYLIETEDNVIVYKLSAGNVFDIQNFDADNTDMSVLEDTVKLVYNQLKSHFGKISGNTTIENVNFPALADSQALRANLHLNVGLLNM